MVVLPRLNSGSCKSWYVARVYTFTVVPYISLSLYLSLYVYLLTVV
jgi:hypothetical protein